MRRRVLFCAICACAAAIAARARRFQSVILAFSARRSARPGLTALRLPFLAPGFAKATPGKPSVSSVSAT